MAQYRRLSDGSADSSISDPSMNVSPGVISEYKLHTQFEQHQFNLSSIKHQISHRNHNLMAMIDQSGPESED